MIPKGMTQAQLEHVKRGGCAVVNGERITLATLGLTGTEGSSAAVDRAVEMTQLKDRIAELETQLSAPAPNDDEEKTFFKEVIEALAPSNSRLPQMSLADLQVWAKYNGIDPEGKEKEALVEELKKQGG